jgi:multiple sugar transport system permease protein
MSGTVTPTAAPRTAGPARRAGPGGLGSYLVRSDAPRQRSHRNFVLRRDRRGVWFVVPFLVVFLLFLVTPLLYAVYQSLYTSKLVGGTSFSGLANYRQTLENGAFWSGFLRVCIFAAIQIPVMLVMSFFFAAMFDLGVARFGKFWRTVFFIPFAVPAVVGTVMWAFLLDPASGPFTHLVHELGFKGSNFFSSSLMVPTIIIIAIWEWTGYNMMILYTALRAVPREVVEAAVMDGASLSRLVLRVKFPMVRPAMVMLVFLNVIGALQLFTEPLLLGAFQPQAISDAFTPTLYIYNTGIGGGQYDLAAAAAVVLALLVVIISVGSLAFRRGKGERE